MPRNSPQEPHEHHKENTYDEGGDELLEEAAASVAGWMDADEVPVDDEEEEAAPQQVQKPGSGNSRMSGSVLLAGVGTITCETCPARSDTTSWYEMAQRVVRGVVRSIPDKMCCKPCGVATEAFPLLDRAAVVSKRNLEPMFRA